MEKLLEEGGFTVGKDNERPGRLHLVLNTKLAYKKTPFMGCGFLYTKRDSWWGWVWGWLRPSEETAQETEAWGS